MSTDKKPPLTIDDLLQEATKLVRDKIPDGLPATVEVCCMEKLLTSSTAAGHRYCSFFIDLTIDGKVVYTGRAFPKLADEIAHAIKAIEKFVSDREAARIERERAEFDQANVGDRFESSGVA